MGRYLSNLLRSGARPIGRRGRPSHRAPSLALLTAERLARLEPEPSSPAQPPAAPPSKPDPVAVEPEARTPAPPVEMEMHVAPVATPVAAPNAGPVAPAAPPRERAPEAAAVEEMELVTETIVQPPATPVAPNLPAHAKAGAQPLPNSTGLVPIREVPKRNARVPRTPAPAQVDTKTERTVGAGIERLAGHRDVRPPQRQLEGQPKVEFITSERVITLVQTTPPVRQELGVRRAEPAPAPRIETPQKAPTLKSETKPQIAPAAPLPVGRLAHVPAPLPPLAAPQPPAASRREPEARIHIGHLDVQIVNEEPRKPVHRVRPTQLQENRSRGLEQHYLREVL